MNYPVNIASSSLSVPGVSESTSLLPLFLRKYDRIHTRRAYWNDLTAFFDSTEVTILLARSVTYFHVNEHIALMETSGKKTATIKRRIAAIRVFYEWLIALNLVQHNPANRQLLRRSGSSSMSGKAMIVLTSEQASSLLNTIQEESPSAIRDKALLLVLLHCVLRRSEAAAMDVEHLRPLGSYWILDIPKAKGGTDQYVKVPDHVAEEVFAMRNHYHINTGPLWRSMSNNSRGRRLSAHAIYRIVVRSAKRAGLPNIGAHALRHTGCTLAIEAGASLQQVQTHARHKSIETTMNYVHQRNRLQNSAADFISISSSNLDSE